MALSQILGVLFLRDSKKAVAFLGSFFIAPGAYAELKRPKMTFWCGPCQVDTKKI